jgi:hypothetical protein
MRVARVAVLAAVVLGGCTSVKMLQRDGCWVRQTKRTLGGTTEDVGPCARAQPRWVDDRLTRLVQECIAQSDYRWQLRALEAWNRREPMPQAEPQEKLIEACMNEAAGRVVTQNETLQARLAEITTDRAALQEDAAQARDHDRRSADRLAEFLGEAAKRPPPVATATATATSDGSATTDSGLTAETGSASQAQPAASDAPALPVLPAASPGAGASPAPAAPSAGPSPNPTEPATPVSRRAKRARAVHRASALRRGSGCEPPVTASAVAPAPAAQPIAEAQAPSGVAAGSSAPAGAASAPAAADAGTGAAP